MLKILNISSPIHEKATINIGIINAGINSLKFVIGSCNNTEDCKINIKITDKNGYNVLHCSAIELNNRFEMLWFLLDYVYFNKYNNNNIYNIRDQIGLDMINLTDNIGNTPLYYLISAK